MQGNSGHAIGEITGHVRTMKRTHNMALIAFIAALIIMLIVGFYRSVMYREVSRVDSPAPPPGNTATGT